MSNAPTLDISDVDYAILRTRTFNRCLASNVSQLYPGKIPVHFLKEMPDFYDGDTGYNLPRHLRNYGCPVAPGTLAETFSDQELIYDDALRFIDSSLKTPGHHLWLLTKGEIITQRLKVMIIQAELKRRLGRQIPPLDYTVIAGDKGPLLNPLWSQGLFLSGQTYPKAHFIDDDPNQLEGIDPKPGLEIIQIYREHDEHKFGRTHRRDVRVVSSLDTLI